MRRFGMRQTWEAATMVSAARLVGKVVILIIAIILFLFLLVSYMGLI
jgi:hypothetical protein